MDTSTLQLTVIYILCAVFLTVPYGSRLSENAASTAAPSDCYGSYTYNRKIGRNANGANLYSAENTLTKCKAKCATISSCTSFDYNYDNFECWIHQSYVENRLASRSRVDHFERVLCPSTSTTASTALPSTYVTGGTLPKCINNYQYDDFEDTYVIGGIEHSHNTLLSCLQACSNSPLTGNSACTAVDFTKEKKCFFHRAAANTLSKMTSKAGDVVHYVRESCVIVSSTPLPTSAMSTLPSPNAVVTFRVMFTNDYDATVRDIDDFIKTFRDEFCDDTGIRCTRLLKPQMPADVKKVTVKENPGPQIGSIIVDGMLDAANDGETNTETVMNEFDTKHYENFRHRLGADNNQQRLKPDTSEDYDGFIWERMPPTVAPVGKEEDDGPLDLKPEYWILIGLAALALIVTVIAVAVICYIRKNSASSNNAQKTKEMEMKKTEKERKKQEKEDKKNEEKEKKEQEKEKKEREREEKEQKKKDKDVEKGEKENQYEDPDVVPTKTDDSPSGLSDDDKAY